MRPAVMIRFAVMLVVASGLLLVLLDLPTRIGPGFEPWTPPGGPAEARDPISREACEQHDPKRRAFFGDLHVHTALSMDTVIRGGTSTPDQAYRFARGEAIVLPPSRTFSLDRPLDFAAVTDHAEWIGETSLCKRPGSPVYDSSSCRTFRGEQPSWMGDNLFGRIAAVVGFFGRNEAICGEDGLACREELGRAWRQTQAAAERWYDRTSACSFSTFHGWEYSASPGRSKVHRNVILRNEIVPELPISWIDEPSAEGLLRKLLERCNDTGSGCEALAIPHNPNVSNGQLFTPDRSGSLEEQRARAELRARLEPLVEMVQAKGESECRSGFAGVMGEDELCDQDKVRWIEDARPPDCGADVGRGALSGRGCQSKLDFARYVLLEGLRENARLGVNPYRHGWIGGTDTHNGTPGATDEQSYPGHNGLTDATLAERISTENDSYAPYRLRSPGGLAGIWAEENTRDALFDAMKRRETFATSGTRIKPRLFGGWSPPEGSCLRDDAPAFADAWGVPMGSTLQPRPEGASSPVFWVSAFRDAVGGAPLQRIQIIKGWVGDDGEFHQEVHDVSGSAAGEADVDRQTCTGTGSGAAFLCGYWADPNFDSQRPAVYYARVLENPTCRWSALQCNALSEADRPEACSDPKLPWRIQERAWTSAIWYDVSGQR
ncbi:MAG: DUF3604 domain-containing protein [Deltaproteobacteria bacterium]|nr:DUF3604 domain-containing protein [Deltaproteobacteria bacterium]